MSFGETIGIPAEEEGEFADGLRKVINEFSAESGSNTPDFILAQYLCDCLAAFSHASLAREGWYGHKFEPGRITELGSAEESGMRYGRKPWKTQTDT